MTQTDFQIFEGNKVDVVLPSTKKVTIRETNGVDDELLSTIGDVSNGDNIHNFLASIITHDYELGKKPSAGDVLGYKTADSWYLMIRQRIHNQGPIVSFLHQGSDPISHKQGPVSYTEDLSVFLVDFEDPNYKDTVIKKYPGGLSPDHEFTISSGQKFKFDIMTGVHEKRRLEIPEASKNMNTNLIVRNLKMQVNGEWRLITHFGFLSSKLLVEIRDEISKFDPDFLPLVDVNTPMGEFVQLPLFTIPTFYWPKGQI